MADACWINLSLSVWLAKASAAKDKPAKIVAIAKKIRLIIFPYFYNNSWLVSSFQNLV
ncbi:MAG: hypothetical protein F6K10_32820 [Moorea sp. SIO2B7]|nr:hypothetical protein [Moorena sp. SIO2B7]